ncbi:hypothetical protein EON77_07780, partial [bacterium]
LLALIDAEGAVLSREDLLRQCWNGTLVGEDAIQRAIHGLRHIAQVTGSGIVVETIPKVGYRLASVDPERLEELLQRGRKALRHELPYPDAQGTAELTEAVTLAPGSARAWGLLALAHRNAAENASPDAATAAVEACEEAARRALELDPRNGDALAALATLRPYFGDWIEAENGLRAVLELDPDNLHAMSHLVTLLQSVGRTNESRRYNDRAALLDPLSPIHQFRRALKFWIDGDGPSADIAIDGAMQLWPHHPAVWNARLMLFAFTGRSSAGLAMLADGAPRPPMLGPPAIDVWRLSLEALDTRLAHDVARARNANLAAAQRSPGFAINAVMVLSALGELDAAFDVTDGCFLRRGPLIGSLWTGHGQMPVNDQRWRRTMLLSTPACAALRTDGRFASLCDGIGLTRYWAERGLRPDYEAQPRGGS